MKQEYICQITWRRQISLLSSAILKFFILGGAYIYVNGFNSPDAILFFICLFFFLLDFLPVVILHIQYLRENRNAILTINKSARQLSYHSPKVNCTYSFDDIILLEYHASFGGGSGWYSFGEYRYYKILFQDGTSIIISCLMMKDIKYTLEPLLGKKAEKRLSFLPFIK